MYRIDIWDDTMIINEAEKIAIALIELKRNTKEYIKFLKGECVDLCAGYMVTDQLYGCMVCKPTNIVDYPEYKGEPLYKYIPFWENYTLDQLTDLIECMGWAYI